MANRGFPHSPITIRHSPFAKLGRGTRRENEGAYPPSRLDLIERRGFHPPPRGSPGIPGGKARSGARQEPAMTFRIAIVQPISHRPGEDEHNVADAVRAIEHAAHEGADFVCFPETYPGPWRMPATFDPTGAMAEAAATHGVHVVFGTIEPIDRRGGAALPPIRMAHPTGAG